MKRDPFIRFLARLKAFKREHPGTWIERAGSFFMDEAKQKWKRYPAFVRNIEKQIHSVLGTDPEQAVIDLSPGSRTRAFFTGSFFTFIHDWFTLVFSIQSLGVSFVLEDVKPVYAKEILYKCCITISQSTAIELEARNLTFSDIAGDMNSREFTRQACKKATEVLNRVLEEGVQTDWRFFQVAHLVTSSSLGEIKIVMLLSFNKYASRMRELDYFQGHILDFLVQDLGIEITDEKFRKNLEIKRERLRRHVRKAYTDEQDDMLATIAHFQHKAAMMGDITYMYDLVAFLVSQLDLSISSVQELLREFSRHHKLSEQEQIVHAYILDVICEQALLYSTFQANFTGIKSGTGNAFMLLLQYYLIDFTSTWLREKMMAGDKLHENTLALFLKDGENLGTSQPVPEEFSRFTSWLQEFIINHYKIQENPQYTQLIKLILNSEPERLLRRFFASFLKTSNEWIRITLETLKTNRKETKTLSFMDMVDFIGDFFTHGLDKVFLHSDLPSASRQFKDPVSRFSEDNVAMSMFELVLFRILPFQGTQWMPTLLHTYKNHLELAPIGIIDNGIVFKKLVPDLSTNYIIHDMALKNTTEFLDRWFFNDIIMPFYEFCFSTMSGDVKKQVGRIHIDRLAKKRKVPKTLVHHLGTLIDMLFAC